MKLLENYELASFTDVPVMHMESGLEKHHYLRKKIVPGQEIEKAKSRIL